MQADDRVAALPGWDVLGLEQFEAWEAEDGGRVVILGAGNATLELVEVVMAPAECHSSR